MANCFSSAAPRFGMMVCMLMLTGCVDRKMTFRSTPPGAEVYLNDQPIGQTPVSVSFTWYGEYDVQVRKAGYQTINVGERPAMPWFEAPPFDFFAEVLWPGTFRPTFVYDYQLQPEQLAEREPLIERAFELRSESGVVEPKPKPFGIFPPREGPPD